MLNDLQQARLTMEDGFTATIRKDIGPINLQFQIPMFCASKLQVRYLQIMKVRLQSAAGTIVSRSCVVLLFARSALRAY